MAKTTYKTGAEFYTGPVCYRDGWHWTVVENAAGYHDPGERLVCEDTPDGSEFRYRLATAADTRSWHDRKHGQFVQVVMEDGAAGITVTAEEAAAIREFLDQRRGQ